MPHQPRIRHDYKIFRPRGSERRPVRLPRLRWIALAAGLATLGVVMAKTNEPGVYHAALGLHLTGGLQQVELTLPPGTVATPADTDGDDGLDWRALTVSSGDSLARLLTSEGIAHRTIHRIVATSEHGDQLGRIRPGERIHIAVDDDGLQTLIHEISVERSLRFERNGSGFDSEPVDRALERRVQHASGTIEDSLVAAGRRAGLSQGTTLALADIFAWDIDFALDLRRGDRFHVVYEAYYRDGQHVRDGDVVAAEFVNGGRAYRALRYTSPDGETDYFAPDGTSVRRAFLRAPVDKVRITSGFGPRRHPKLHTMRDHNGVDYGAPTGTPVRATGDGRIVRHGWRGGYGRTVVIQHGERYSTLYAHMARFHPERAVGSRVSQGDVIGYVGQSGLATGPHLHYEFLIDGIHRNPQTVELPSGDPVDDAHRADFEESTRALIAQLDTLQRSYAVAQH